MKSQLDDERREFEQTLIGQLIGQDKARRAAERLCLICGTPIDKRRSHAKVCSGACRAVLSRRERGIERARRDDCIQCGEPIVGRRADAVYCDDECKRAYNRARADAQGD